jgi:hypothetical protein
MVSEGGKQHKCKRRGGAVAKPPPEPPMVTKRDGVVSEGGGGGDRGVKSEGQGCASDSSKNSAWSQMDGSGWYCSDTISRTTYGDKGRWCDFIRVMVWWQRGAVL